MADTELRYTPVATKLISESRELEAIDFPYHLRESSQEVHFELHAYEHPKHGKLVPHVTGVAISPGFPLTACVSLIKEDGTKIDGASFYSPRQVYA